MTQSSRNTDSSNEIVESFRVDMVWNGANDHVNISAGGPIDGITNYYLGHCREGVNDVRSFRKLVYKDLYPGVAEMLEVKSGKLAAFLADGQQPKFSAGLGDELVKSTEIALELLRKNKKGMFLMIEGSQIDWGGHNNDVQYIIDEMIDFDNAIGKVLDFAARNGNTLVIITADHETGGFSINGGDMKTGQVAGKFTTGSHTGVMVPVFAYGPGSERFSGIYENTEIFHRMMRAFRFAIKL